MLGNNIQPIFILPEGTQRTSGKSAQNNNIAAAKAVAETIRTTLGPKGMDKMIVDSLGDIIVTNDGVTILKEMNVEHPAGKMIVEIAKTQEKEVGDGTTTAVVLAGEFLKEAELLLDQDIHPTVINKGYRIALNHALKVLKDLSKKITIDDDDLLLKISMTAMTGKGVEDSKDFMAKLTVDAVKSIFDSSDSNTPVDLEDVKIESKAGGNILDSQLVKGIVLDKERVHSSMPKKVENSNILLLDVPLEIKSTEIDAKINITNPEQIQSFLEMEEKMLKKMVDKIKEKNVNVVFCQKGIDDIAQHFLSKYNILAVRRVTKSDLDKISKATGASIVSNLDSISESDIGFAGRVEEKFVGDENMIFVEECKNPKSVTLLLRGSTEHVLDEVKRAVDDALGDLASALKNNFIVPGAGAVEIELSRRLKELSEKYSGREQLAIESFAKSLEVIPKTLAENSGLDPIDVITELKAAHENGSLNAGINVESGKIIDSLKEGIVEPLLVKTQALTSATEVTNMILRIDDIIVSGSGDKNNENTVPSMNNIGM